MSRIVPYLLNQHRPLFLLLQHESTLLTTREAVAHLLGLAGWNPSRATLVADQLVRARIGVRSPQDVGGAISALPKDAQEEALRGTAEAWDRHSYRPPRLITTTLLNPDLDWTGTPFATLARDAHSPFYSLATCGGPGVVCLFGGADDDRRELLRHINNPDVATLRSDNLAEIKERLGTVEPTVQLIVIDGVIRNGEDVNRLLEARVTPPAGALGFARITDSDDRDALFAEDIILTHEVPYTVLPRRSPESAARRLALFGGL